MQTNLKNINIEIGKVIKLYREKQHISQEELSERLNISPKFLSRIENGRTGTSYETLLKLIDFLNIPPNIMFKNIVKNQVVLNNINISQKYENLSESQKRFVDILITELIKIDK